jgi:hypothetical protein
MESKSENENENVKYSEWQAVPPEYIRNLNFPTFYRNIPNPNSNNPFDAEKIVLCDVNELINEYFSELERKGDISHKKSRKNQKK